MASSKDQVAAVVRQGAAGATRRTAVPAAVDMDDETFFKHYNARHLDDVGLAQPMHYHGTVSASMVAAYRSYHERVHSQTSADDHTHKEAS